MSEKAFSTHMYILGATGEGKSRAIESWFMQLAQRGEGVCVIDPHGELFHNLLARIAATRNRSLWERVVVLDPLDPDFIPGFNPLQVHPGEYLERKARFLANVVTTVWRADPLITSRMQRMMYFTFLLLSTFGMTLRELPLVLTQADLRAALLAQLPEAHSLRLYWEHEFPSNPRTVTEWTQSTLNKAGSLADDPDLALFFGQRKSTIDFRQMMDEGRVLLVNLSKGQLVSDTSHLLGAFVMAQVQQSALARAEDTYARHRPFTLFVDEFQNYTTENIQEILAESRKYALRLVLAHQFYEQLAINPELQAAVRNTVGNYVIFRLGYEDAGRFVHDVFSPEIDQVKEVRIRYPRIEGIETPVEEPLYRGQDEIWEHELRKLTELKKREFWFKERGSGEAFKVRSLNMPDVRRSPELDAKVRELVALSNARWARRKEDVRKELQQRSRRLLQLAKAGSLDALRRQQSKQDGGEDSLWV